MAIKLVKYLILFIDNHNVLNSIKIFKFFIMVMSILYEWGIGLNG